MSTPRPSPTLRLLADDLTGALDTAAEFVGLVGPVPVFWHGAVPEALPPGAAIDTGTREAGLDAALAAVGAAAPALRGGTIAYRKLDSLLRGNWAAEVAACWHAGGWTHGVFAPAFPQQRRVTRGGRHYAASGEGWAPVGGDLVAALRAAGLPALPGRPDAPLPPGLSVFDAETEADLERIAAIGRGAGMPVLWCGSGGLARALMGEARVAADTALRGPVLGLFGSDQGATARQLAACGAHWHRLPDGGAASAARLAAHLGAHGVALASLDLPDGTARDAAARRIADALDSLAQRLGPPGTLIVAGGETLKSLCLALGTGALVATGQVAPGVPRSAMRGGRWDGVEVVSKSGAFGGDALWRDLLAENGLISGKIEA
ncbi:four-carbon acid sugar kinase family protein [Roseomonas sp. NAR14]|uniref:Four-carbon acid sugar kinase family protein n=1 Tax=Roseomonas acroporae TaxID=2937791 RepID=A0A9X1Y8Z8_9PROT|nr:four-carbon acid sugar kinase family protein [Roseomonas acroporae]MCK8785733.1 four-carbon acid sugar kinase family protein [Roseomonas acroporae]